MSWLYRKMKLSDDDSTVTVTADTIQLTGNVAVTGALTTSGGIEEEVWEGGEYPPEEEVELLPEGFSIVEDTSLAEDITEEEIEEEQRLLYVGITRAESHLSLSLHHEGSRGGITQFNKISRFIDVPNVLSKLDLRGGGTQQLPDHRQEEAEPVVSPYDKSSLLRRIMDFYK